MSNNYIIIVDDDADFRALTAEYLSDHNIGTKSASNREELFQRLKAGRPSIILLDVELGNENGLDLLREIRSQSDVPVIITSDCFNAEHDRVIGLDLGADDYLVKPFGLRELLARVRAIMRRTEAPGHIQKTAKRYRFQGWTLECRTRKLSAPEGVLVRLTRREYELLLIFLKTPFRCLTKEYLIQATTVHGDISKQSITRLIASLRRKIEKNPSEPEMIQTEHGLGYTFALRVDPLDSK